MTASQPLIAQAALDSCRSTGIAAFSTWAVAMEPRRGGNAGAIYASCFHLPVVERLVPGLLMPDS
jgi:hypothetical protein